MQLTLPIPEFEQLTLGAPRPEQRIYCNRSLRLDHIDWVGFDMDYTLAAYKQHEMDRLSIEATVQKLVARGYPKRLLDTRYNTAFPIRGLLIDRKLGNVLKMDRYKYVKRAYHGTRELTREERRKIYHTRKLRPASKRYHWVDTLYGLPEVAVFSAAVETLREEAQVDFDQLFADIRDCIDLSHKDNSILGPMMADFERYLDIDLELPRTLHHLRSSGKKLFVLTNSYPEYTEAMLSFLFNGKLPGYHSWRRYFDLVITASHKPRFFTEESPLLEVLDDGSTREATDVKRGRLYMNGNLGDLMARLDTTPDRVLYVGDHIFGDMLQANKSSAWRTALILQEMDGELSAHEDVVHSLERLDALEEIRGQLIDDLRDHQRAARLLDKERRGTKLSAKDEANFVRHKKASERLRSRIRATEREYDELERGVDQRFHAYWGSLFKAGNEQSSFGHQVEHYANVYTARVSNFLQYSPMHFFQSPRDRMPHEL